MCHIVFFFILDLFFLFWGKRVTPFCAIFHLHPYFFFFRLPHACLIPCLLFPLYSSLMKTTCPWFVHESVMWDSIRRFPSTVCKPPFSPSFWLSGRLPRRPHWPLPVLAAGITAVFHHIFGASFRSRQFSRAPFSIKIPFHKTAFTNSSSGLKSSGLSSLVHCFHSFLSWNSRALLICDLFHPDRLPPAAASQPVFPR